MIRIEIIFIAADGSKKISTKTFEFAPQVRDVLTATPWVNELNLAELQTSVWGRTVVADDVLADGDRIELTRNLIVDPKLARARKVAQRPRRGWVQRVKNEDPDGSP